MFLGSVVRATEEVVEYSLCRRGKKGSVWWTDEMKEAVEKRKTYKKMLEKCDREDEREVEEKIQGVERLVMESKD